MLRSSYSDKKIAEEIQNAVMQKPKEHNFNEKITGNSEMFRIGG
jgi:hypothetical protein